MTKISVINIAQDTIVDGPGLRTSIYAAGCSHHCKGCHNPESWCINSGNLYDIDDILDIVKEGEFANVTFSGGDPLYQCMEFTELAKRIKEETNKTIWCYTGYTIEQIKSSANLSSILKYIDVLVDGKFIETQKDLTLRFRGSRNQRILHAPF